MEIIIIIALIVVNGIFAMTEMALVSSRKTRLHELAENGDVGARDALRVLKEPNRFLSTIQVGITLVGILAGAFGGATIAGEPIDLPSLLTRPLFVPEGSPARTMLENFRQSRVTIALVVDEYGSIQGITTLHDLLEANVGDLPSVDEGTDPDMVQRRTARGCPSFCGEVRGYDGHRCAVCAGE